MNFVDNEELADRSRRQRRKQKRDLVWNVLTGIAVIATVTLIGMLALIFSNPHIGLNPFPPPTMPVLIDLSTKTPTLVYLPPTWTPTARSTETPKGEATATSTPKTAATTQVPPTFAPTFGNGLYSFELESAPIAHGGHGFPHGWQLQLAGVTEQGGGHERQSSAEYPRAPVWSLQRQDDRPGYPHGLAAEWYGPSGFEFKLSEKAIEFDRLAGNPT